MTLSPETARKPFEQAEADIRKRFRLLNALANADTSEDQL
jgi:hypothetical protein